MRIFPKFGIFLTISGCLQSADLSGGSRRTSDPKPSNVVLGKSEQSDTATSETISSDFLGDVVGRCKTASVSEKSFPLSFPATKGQCNWEAGMAASEMRGHFEQRLSLDIPDSWVVCKLGISSQKSDFRYDDHIVMSVNDRLLWGNTGIFELLSSNKDEFGLVKYDWASLVGKRSADQITCMGGSSVCSGPGTETNGNVSVSLTEETNAKLMGIVLRDKKIFFDLVITGDNDPSIDCAHNGLPLDVKIQYYLK